MWRIFQAQVCIPRYSTLGGEGLIEKQKEELDRLKEANQKREQPDQQHSTPHAKASSGVRQSMCPVTNYPVQFIKERHCRFRPLCTIILRQRVSITGNLCTYGEYKLNKYLVG